MCLYKSKVKWLVKFGRSHTMLFIGAWRISDLINKKSQKELELMKLKQKLSDLQSYSSSIGDGSVSMNDLMQAPSSVFNRMSMFMMYSHQAALSGAQEKFNFMMMTPGAMPQLPNPQQQQQYSQMAFKALYEQEKDKFKKVEEKNLNEQEKKISMQSEQLQTELKMIEGELTATKEGTTKSATDSAPKYV